LPNLKPGFKSS